MNIGSQYDDKKLYRGIKHADGLPLTSEDLHEYADTQIKKTDYLLSSILGSGMIKEPSYSLTSGNLFLSEPLVLNIEGDIALVKQSTSPLFSDWNTSGSTTEGIIAIVGWYQLIDSTTTMKEYGGVNNDTLTNDLVRSPLDMQVSTRYQFRWDVVGYEGVDKDLSNLPTNFTFKNRDKDGTMTSGTNYVVSSTATKIDSLYKGTAAQTISYAINNQVYIIPILHYTYDTLQSVVTSIRSIGVRKTSQAKVINISVTLTVADWVEDADTGIITQSVSNENITATNTLIVSPDSDSWVAYFGSGIRATAQSNGSITFTCDAIPETDVLVNIAIL